MATMATMRSCVLLMSPSIPPSPYQKQHDVTSHADSESDTPSTIYVVSAPDATDHFHSVPAGAFPTSSPYTSLPNAPAPPRAGTSSYTAPHVRSEPSTSSAPLSHPITTRRVPVNPSSVGGSAAVRWASAPAAMGAYGGSFGGIALMDREGTVYPARGLELADRNLPPIGEPGEEMGYMGASAWKSRR
ncbi:hypothetical protein BD779DRAFT_1803080 [Infundibulicybe gibba]|nr:hypothetical protein BD779DRAFT_1803080 [Infundibulicybe gibba]